MTNTRHGHAPVIVFTHIVGASRPNPFSSSRDTKRIVQFRITAEAFVDRRSPFCDGQCPGTDVRNNFRLYGYVVIVPRRTNSDIEYSFDIKPSPLPQLC